MKFIRKKFDFKKINRLIILCIIFLGIFKGEGNIIKAEQLKDLRYKEYIKFGKYLNEPIVWRVINIKGNKALILSDRIITFKCFDAKDDIANDPTNNRDNYGSNDWNDSNLRLWLNSDKEMNIDKYGGNGRAPISSNLYSGFNPYENEKGFLSECNFSKEDRELIIPIEITHVIDTNSDIKDGGENEHGYTKKHYQPDSMVDGYDTAAYKKSQDSVFLLNIREIADYLDGQLKHPDQELSYHYAYTTSVCREQSNYNNDPESDTDIWEYWTRDAYTPNSFSTRFIEQDGEVGYSLSYIDYHGVRPAMYLDLNKISVKGGDGKKAQTAYDIVIVDNKDCKSQLEGRKYFKYYLGKDKRNIIKLKLVGVKEDGVFKDDFNKNDILDDKNQFKKGIYIIDKDGRVKEY